MAGRPTSEAIEQRRRRNREAMQRARQREREEIEGMRRDIRVLEQQYRQALQQAAQALAPADGSVVSSATTTSDVDEDESNGSTLFLEYKKLARTSKALQTENFRLTKLLDAKRKAYERMERILADYHEQKSDVPDDPRDPRFYMPEGDAELPFGRLTESDAATLIMQWVREIRQFESTSVDSVSIPPVSESFGWSLKQAVFDRTRIFWLLTKQVPNLCARAAAEKAWTEYQSIDSNNVAKPMRVTRFELLQVVNENTQVVVRDIVHPLHPGVTMRTLMLRFRMETETGYAIGRANMIPRGSEETRVLSTDPVLVRRADMSTWLEFEPLDPANPERPGCIVKFAGYSDYGTTFDLSERLVTILLATLHVESRVIGPLTPLLTRID